MNAHPDAVLPHEELGLQQFNRLAKRILEGDGDHVFDFTRAVLAGRYFDEIDAQERRIYLDGLYGLTHPTVGPRDVPLARDQYRISRDYDSILGYSETLPYNQTIGIFPVPPLQETLSKAVHITVPCRNRSGDLVHIDLGRIPNAVFAKVGARGKCNIVFPALYPTSVSTMVGRELNLIFYQEVLRPALLAIDLDQVGHWPPDYAAAERRARDHQGRYHFGSIDVPVDKLPELVIEMKLLMANIREFRGAFFYHEVRGVKGGSGHDPEDDEDVREAFDEVCEYLDWNSIPAETRDQFYIDIGIEIRRPGHVMHWRSGNHLNVLRNVLPSATDPQRHAIMKSPNFHHDAASQLTDFAGFRVAPLTRGAADGVAYINVYSTEKEIHYQLHKGMFARAKPRELLPQAIKMLSKRINEWTKSFFASTGVEGNTPQEAAARCEIRVRMRQYDQVLRHWDDALVQQLTSSIPSKVWWTFKWNRATACWYVISNMQTVARPAERAWAENLALGAAVIYILNALLYTEPEAAMWAPMQTHVQMRIADEDDPMYDEDDLEGDNMVMETIGTAQGLFFLGELVNDRTVFRLSRHHNIPLPEIVRIYGESTDYGLRALFGTAGVTQDTRKANPLRRNNKMSITSRVETTRLEPVPVLDFGMADRELRMAGGVDISGPDVEAAVAEVEEPDGMDARLSNFWFQMLFDVMRKAPNPRSCVLPSYMDMKPIECTQIEEDFFKTFELPFRQVRYKVVEFDYWQNTMFNRFFPPRSSVLPPNLQNFPSCQYFKDYTALMGHVTKADSVEIRNALRERWNRLYWLPITGYDRMWVTRTTMSGHHVTLPDGYNRSAPQIAFNPLYFKHGETLVTLRGAVDQYPE